MPEEIEEHFGDFACSEEDDLFHAEAEVTALESEPVDLPARIFRKTLEDRHPLRHHIRRNDPGNVANQFFRRLRTAQSGETNNLPQAVSHCSIDHGAFLHLRHAVESGFDFFELNPIAHVFHLKISATNEMQPAIRIAPHEVARAVADIRKSAMGRVLDEDPGRAVGIIVVTKPHAGPPEKQFSHIALASLVCQDLVIKIRRKEPERRQRLHIGKVRRPDRVSRANAGAFGWAVDIFQIQPVPQTDRKAASALPWENLRRRR